MSYRALSARNTLIRAERTHHGGGPSNLFAVNPLRRSFIVAAACWLTLIVPITLLHGEWQAMILIGAGWIAVTGAIFVTPLFVWCLVERGWEIWFRHRCPTVEQLELTPRALNLLARHGYTTIAQLDRASDESLLMLSNMDTRTVREIRRAVSIWKYLRWQARGFPVDETPETAL
jgi:hypothetical protein